MTGRANLSLLLVAAAVILLGLLGSCASTGEERREEATEDDAQVTAEEREPQSLELEPVIPRDGAPVSRVPVLVTFGAPDTEADPFDDPGRVVELRLYTDEDAGEESLIYRERVTARVDIPIPAEVLVDGRSYYYRLAVAEGPTSALFSFRTAVNAPVPTPTAPAPGAVTFDRTPTFEAAIRIPDGSDRRLESYEYELRNGPGLPLAEPLEFGRSYEWRVRARFASGFRSAWSDWSSFTPSRDFGVEPRTVGRGLPTFGLTPSVEVSSVPGATRYRFELSRTSTPPAGEEPAGEEAPEEPAAEPDAPDDEPAARRRVLEADEPRIVPSLEEGSAYTIRVQVENDTGDRLGWFGPFAFTAARFEMPFAEIIESGEEASFSPVGVTNVPEDFRIRLTRPYAMAVTELSNRHAARIINWALAFGHARLDRETRRVLYLPDEETEAAEPQEAGGAPLVYLGDLFVGVQLGLQLAAEEPRLVPVTGREEHPAVGISWYGAAAIANYYSRIQGLDPVYDISQAGLNEGDPWDRERRGYRLPTEAEWEFAAIGESGAAYPWGQDVSGARVNYFRSADPFEAVTPPYSAQGGPTTPTAFFDGTVRDGYRTLSNASPAGVFDLVGNVWEWCFDWYIPEIPGADVDARLLSDPRGPAEPEPDAYGTVYRVVRGTGWNTRGENVLVGNRGRFDPAEGSYATGVRLVRDLPGVSR